MIMKKLRKSSKIALACSGVLLTFSLVSGGLGMNHGVRLAVVAIGTLISAGLYVRQWQAENPVDEDGDR